ncbi:MAG: LTA synthase family protein [Nitrospirae bacterium]|nr:LTA synthase family protein [Nitrospirota bacterium]
MTLSGKGSLQSFRRVLVFWWMLFLVIQQAERLFLLPEAIASETPSLSLLAKTLATGLRADLITATIAVLLAALLAGAVGIVRASAVRWFGAITKRGAHSRALMRSCGAVGVLLMVLLIVDMGYYGYNQQRLNFVFFEYLGDLFVQARGGAATTEHATMGDQAIRQSAAELGEVTKWGGRLIGFFLMQAVAIGGWWLLFRRAIEPALARWETAVPGRVNAMVVLGLIIGAAGAHPQGPYAIRIVEISSATYYTLAQNPVVYASEALRATIASKLSLGMLPELHAMPVDEAIHLAQDMLGGQDRFPSTQYPFVRERKEGQAVRLPRLANILLVYIEGLDRRYLGTTKQGYAVTPFLDRLKGDSVYFERFFTNGTQTSRGLFASFCSYYPRQGTSAMKTRYTHDYLCLPSLLQKAGYHTEMVIGHHRDLNRLHLFMSRNGLQHLYDESDFPEHAERLGLGLTDGALFDFLRSRIETLQEAGRPFNLATMTLSTHHPFKVPLTHPAVRALQAEPDGYIAALRYADLEFERFFTELQRDGLLKNTVLFILGDHGRHERVGRTDLERQVGHFMSPLFIWMDESLRSPSTYRPRIVRAVASQVDLAPTILALNGLTPRLSPFVGRDLSCALVEDCLQDNFAFLTSVYDDMIGIADKDGVSVYSLRTGRFYRTDHRFEGPAVQRAVNETDADPQFRQMLALYISSNVLLEQNRVWSWMELGGKL